MSDGNFNRSLLPHNPYSSGLHTGKALARMKAAEAFSEWLRNFNPSLSDEEIARQTTAFATLLAKKI
ncbi:MAG: hypothetical protein K6F94_01955 [Bacteroidaceae bacterium]|nr:hypothetical protein [Bacteroidaceae bacterium]